MSAGEGAGGSCLSDLCVAVHMSAFWRERYVRSEGMDFDLAVSEGSYATKMDLEIKASVAFVRTLVTGQFPNRCRTRYLAA